MRRWTSTSEKTFAGIRTHSTNAMGSDIDAGTTLHRRWSVGKAAQPAPMSAPSPPAPFTPTAPAALPQTRPTNPTPYPATLPQPNSTDPLTIDTQTTNQPQNKSTTPNQSTTPQLHPPRSQPHTTSEPTPQTSHTSRMPQGGIGIKPPCVAKMTPWKPIFWHSHQTAT